jgi:hypothetical protein
MMDQHTPEIQNEGELIKIPQWCSIMPPTLSSQDAEPRSRQRHNGKMISNDSAVNALRQKVTSNRAADSNCRETTPAMDHSNVAKTISQTAWV